MSYDQAQSPRLGQKIAPENPGVRIATLDTLPEVAYRGQIVYLEDVDYIYIYDGASWQAVGDATGSQVYVSETDPNDGVNDLHEGDQWMKPSTKTVKYWRSSPPGWVDTAIDLAGYVTNATLAAYAKTSDLAPYEKAIVGEVKMWAGAGALPAGFLACNGQSLLTTSYPALFAVIGYTYGGSGANFFMPDFRGRGPQGLGTGDHANATGRTLGQKGGQERVMLTASNIAAHTHPATATTVATTTGTTNSVIQGNGFLDRPTAYYGAGGYGLTVSATYANRVMVWGATGGGDQYDPGHSHTLTAATTATTTVTVGANTGTTTSVDNQSPFLGMNFIIRYSA